MRILPALFAIALLAPATAAGAGNALRVNRDPMTDLVTHVAWLNNDGNLSIVVTCDEKAGSGGVDLAIWSKGFLGEGTNRLRDVAFRFDGAAPVKMTGLYADTLISLGAPATPSSDGGQIIRRLRTGRHVVVRVTDFHDIPVTEEFDLGDARTDIDKTIAACGGKEWTSATR